MADKTQGVSFKLIAKIASEMSAQGIKPTVRGVIAVTGGKTEVVSKYLRDFFNKRDAEVEKMADEMGSSNVAKLIAGEIQVIVDKRTAELSEINERQKKQINEQIELLEEKADENERIKEETENAITKINQEANIKVDNANLKVEKAIASLQLAEKSSAEEKIKAENLVSNAEEKALALVEAANQRANQSEQETKSLREQVKSLSIDEAKREIEQAEFKTLQKILDKLRIELAEQKTEVVKVGAENKAHLKDVSRLESDNKEYKQKTTELTKYQTLLIESQKTLTNLQSELAISERERESLSHALSIK